MSWIPTPTRSNPCCRFPARGLLASLRKKVYGTQPIGDAFDPDESSASTPHPPTAPVFPFLYISWLRSCRLLSVFIRRPCLPSLPEELRNSRAPSLHDHYAASQLLPAPPPPSRLPPFSWVHQLYGFLASAIFMTGRGGLLQLLDVSLSPCCPYHPAGVSCRLGQPAPCHAAFAPNERARPPDL